MFYLRLRAILCSLCRWCFRASNGLEGRDFSTSWPPWNGVSEWGSPICRQLSICCQTPRSAWGAVSVSTVLVPVSPGQGRCSRIMSLCLDQGHRQGDAGRGET